MTQEQTILKLLKTGKPFSKAQLKSAVNGTDKSVLGRISDLRASGYAIYTNSTKKGQTYRLGKPRREMVAVCHSLTGTAFFQ